MILQEDQYLNFHAHRLSDHEEEWVLTSLSAVANPESYDLSKGNYSIGLHPWDVKSADIDAAMQVVYEAAKAGHVIGIGETGLDKVIDLPLGEQIPVFERHIEIAEKIGMPLIIHSVKTTQELLSCKKRHGKRIPWIIHGYRGGIQEAKDLVRAGLYFSVGEAVIHVNKVRETVAQLPLKHMFIETDEADIPVEEIYAAVSELKSVSIEDIRLHMRSKFQELFNLENNE